jgi:hypothetical protein
MRRSRSDSLLAVVRLVALGLTLSFKAHYGNVYRIGDSEHRAVGLSDQLAYVVPGLAFAGCAALLVLRRLSGGSVRAQWNRERELLRAARSGH